MKSYRADEHYAVHRTGRDSMGDIVSISCNFCPTFAVHKSQVGQPKSSKSGFGRYSRMRARMTQHLKSDHPGVATERDVAKYGPAP